MSTVGVPRLVTSEGRDINIFYVCRQVCRTSSSAIDFKLRFSIFFLISCRRTRFKMILLCDILREAQLKWWTADNRQQALLAPGEISHFLFIGSRERRKTNSIGSYLASTGDSSFTDLDFGHGWSIYLFIVFFFSKGCECKNVDYLRG